MKRFQIEYIEKDALTVVELSARSQAEAVEKFARLHDGCDISIKVKQI